ncbi:MAG: hypothetical protein VYD64_02135 [Pseudomonadota bacterium]|nr:hypothetical protein [Pseudomonadota bacterium]
MAGRSMIASASMISAAVNVRSSADCGAWRKSTSLSSTWLRMRVGQRRISIHATSSGSVPGTKVRRRPE